MANIKDSGARRVFESGAVRDITEGKGRCDLLPLEEVAGLMDNTTIHLIASFIKHDEPWYLDKAVLHFAQERGWDLATMILEVSKHFEDGAKKYGEYNWQKGIDEGSYINSGVRHYLKWLRGDQDEPHDRAFVWNMLCLIWTINHREELKK